MGETCTWMRDIEIESNIIEDQEEQNDIESSESYNNGRPQGCSAYDYETGKCKMTNDSCDASCYNY